MRISLMSDLHLEFADLKLPGGDILILAGDVCEAKNLKIDEYDPNHTLLAHERPDRRIDRYARFFVEECRKYNKVLYVMGNHEHYHFCFDNTYDHINNQLPDNVYLLENQSIDIEDVHFIGATLWTNCNNNDPVTIYTLREAMNDYVVIKKKPGPNHNFYGKLTPEATMYAHKVSRAYIEKELADNADRKCVVITHHAPSSYSINEKYKPDTQMNGAYFSNLENMILDNQNCLLWCHGHMHDPCDYKIGDTTILCNPRGYVNYERRADEFDPTVGYDI
jgi:Icc-related predicted phosphoesterase